MCVVQSVACACVFCLLVCVVWFPLAMHVWLQVYSTVGLFFKWLDWFCGACHGSWSAVAVRVGGYLSGFVVFVAWNDL